MKNTQVRPSVCQLFASRLGKNSLLRMDRSPSDHQLFYPKAIPKSGGTYHISHIPYTQLIPLHLLLKPIPGIFQIYPLPFPNLLSPVRNSPFFVTLSLATTNDSGHTEFQGARVQLNPGASIMTSRLYWSSAGIPKKPIISLHMTRELTCCKVLCRFQHSVLRFSPEDW